MGSWLKVFSGILFLIFFFACSTPSVPRNAAQRFNAENIKKLSLYIVNDPTWCGSVWTHDEMRTISRALSEVINEKGYKIDNINHLSINEAQVVFGTC